jgi:hypothetical protein
MARAATTLLPVGRTGKHGTSAAPKVRMSMWQRKNDAEIARDRPCLWLSFGGPVLWFVFLFVGGFLIALEGPRLLDRPWPATWSQVLSRSTSFAAIVALVVYVLQIACGREIHPLRIGNEVVICDKCHRIIHRTGTRKCKCGGNFDDFDNWEWTDE